MKSTLATLLVTAIPFTHAAVLRRQDDCRIITLEEAQSFTDSFATLLTRNGDVNETAANILSTNFTLISNGVLSYQGEPVMSPNEETAPSLTTLQLTPSPSPSPNATNAPPSYGSPTPTPTPTPSPVPGTVTSDAASYLAFLTTYNLTSLTTTRLELSAPDASCITSITWIYDFLLDDNTSFPIKAIGILDVDWEIEGQRWVATRYEVEFDAFAAAAAAGREVPGPVPVGGGRA
ncbi:hypothetical protein PRZ48_005887 [Zasmidium cellare]|uniref:NTF2-like domain-containing protein n=1 Tax=Zasmidium cellare TaxID=395010 RepID=A0ABR0ELU0_ZASCE|nr:hypothetical protein PRZ48_005887 [Zasmidium cellare]